MTGSRIVEAQIDVGALMARVTDASCGAVAVFVGTVREVNDGRRVSGIDYSAYATMAVKEMDRIVAEAGELFDGSRIAVEHRVGYLGLGEASVAIAAAHPHRAPALDAMRYVIEELKRRVPVWKREHYADGTREWVDPTRVPAEVRE
jgi:molybdopterin synthase catalytic subunit